MRGGWRPRDFRTPAKTPYKAGKSVVEVSKLEAVLKAKGLAVEEG